jgi:O-antigen/teichoic acid export membrane protein
MLAHYATVVAQVIGMCLLFAFALVHFLKHYRGNRFFQSRGIILALFFVLVALISIPKFPAEFLIPLSALISLLSLLTFALLRQR